MVQLTCQCCLLAFSSVLLVVHPTLELVVREPVNQLMERRIDASVESKGRLELLTEGLTYRPNERDKSSLELRPKRLKRSKRKRSEDSQRSADSFVFPDQVPSKTAPLENRLYVVPNTAGPPACAHGDSTFCESVDEYPAEHVIRLLKKEPVFIRRFFQEDRREYSLADNVEDRIDVSDENPLCVAVEQIVYPKMAKNIEGNWLFVINQDEYKQGVRVEKCLNDRGECNIPTTLPNNYRSQCKQKYIYRKLVALNGTGQGVITDSFPLPSCCSCVIKFDRGGAVSRIGGGGPNPLPLTLPKWSTTPSTAKT